MDVTLLVDTASALGQWDEGSKGKKLERRYVMGDDCIGTLMTFTAPQLFGEGGGGRGVCVGVWNFFALYLDSHPFM